MSIGNEVTLGGRLLRRWLPGKRNARSPTVDSCVYFIPSWLIGNITTMLHLSFENFVIDVLDDVVMAALMHLDCVCVCVCVCVKICHSVKC